MIRRVEDLAPLLAQQPSGAVGFRQGTVVAWDPITASNVVNVGGTLLTDVPILNTAEAGLLAPGDVVGLLSTGEGARSFWIVGRITVPGTPQAGSALSAWAGRGVLATAPGPYAFTDTSFAPARDSSGPTATGLKVGVSGSALVFISAELYTPGGDFATAGIKAAWMSFQVTGPTSVGPDFERALGVEIDFNFLPPQTGVVAGMVNATRLVPLAGLTPGTYTIDARYRIAGGDTNQATAQNRSIFAVPI